jgi:hypothetical protein
MAVLSKEDRIAMSRKIITVEQDTIDIDNAIEQIKLLQQQAIKDDSLNEFLQQPYTDMINLYQPEYNHIDGNLRTELTEDLMNAAAQGLPQNGFFLTDPTLPIQSVPDGIWKSFSPMAFCYGIGKKPSETYDSVVGEEPSFNRMLELIAQAEATYSISARATGKRCITVGVPPFDTQQAVNQTGMINLMNELIQRANEWIEALKKEKEVIVLNETVAERLAENQEAYNQIDPTIAEIKSWLSIRTFQRARSCPLKESWRNYPVVKMHPTSIERLNEIIDKRKAFLEIRKSQLNKWLGFVDQNIETGILENFGGWYGERFLLIETRLNLISGTASSKFGADKQIQAQEEVKASNKATAAAYALTMRAAKAVAPGLNTQYLNFDDASDFEVGEEVYVVADNQRELAGTILEKDGNRLKFSFTIPKKYTLSNVTRLYKIVENIL